MKELTIKEYAVAERVTPRTVRRWIDKGAIPVRRTPGGGVRVVVLGAAQLGQMRTSADILRHPSQ